MKPNQEYSDAPRSAPSTLAEAFQGLITELFVDLARPEVAEGGRVSGMSADAFRKYYVPTPTTESSERISARLGRDGLGRTETDILERVLLSEPGLTVFTGDIGSGKSTLLNYVFRVVPENGHAPGVGTSLITAFCDVETLRTKIRDTLAPPTDTELIDLNKVLLDESVSESFCTQLLSRFIDDDAFWTWLEARPGYEEHRRKRLFTERMALDEPKRMARLAEVRERLSDRGDFGLRLAGYAATKGIVPVVILDNVDPMLLGTQIGLLRIAHSACERYDNLRIVLALRRSSFEKIRKVEQTRIRPVVRLDPPGLREVVKRRVEQLPARVLRDAADAPLFVKDKRVSIAPGSIRDFFERLTQYLLNDQVVRTLELLSMGNRREALSLMSLYFNSPNHAPISLLASGVTGASPDEQVPLWIFYTAVLTQNYPTFDAEHADMYHGLVNLYCNGPAADPFASSIRLMILRYLQRTKGGHRVPGRALIDNWLEMFPGVDDIKKEKIVADVCYGLKRLVEKGLVTSPNLTGTNGDYRVLLQADISLSRLGVFYLDEFAWLFEYLFYVKDDVDYPDDAPLAAAAPRCRTASDRASSVVHFIRHLWSQEVRHLSSLARVGGLPAYFREFGPELPFTFFAEIAATRVLHYLREREWAATPREQLRKLSVDMAHTAATKFPRSRSED